MMDWQRWIRSAERQIDLLEYTIRCGADVEGSAGAYLANLGELVKQVEDIHGQDRERPLSGEADPTRHGFEAGTVTPEACIYCGLRRIMHDTDAPAPEEEPGS
jgi:hypothetical protein